MGTTNRQVTLRNETAVADPPKSKTIPVRLVANVKTADIRVDNLQGREYTVVPMVMLVEGVHNGSAGAYYYPAEECSKLPHSWNSKPVVIYHPDGETACLPEILNTRGIGNIMNTKWDTAENRLVAEAWIDMTLVNKVDPRVAKAIDEKLILELSTGLDATTDGIPGEWNGEEHLGTLSNFSPDHVAILPDQIGACSVADGAGFFRNSTGEKIRIPLDMLKHLNELSLNSIRSQIQSILDSSKGKDDDWSWVEDVFSDHVIYEQGGILYRRTFTIDNDTIMLTGIPETVVKKITYETLNPMNKENEAMKKEEIIADLIANSQTKWKEEHKELLNKMDVEALQLMLPEEEKPKEDPKDTNTQNKKQEPEKKVVSKTLEQSLEEMHPSVRRIVQNALTTEKQQKEKLVEIISNHDGNDFSKEFLMQKDVQELQGIAKLIKSSNADDETPMFNYSGQAGSPRDNESTEDIPSLDLPVMNFEKVA